jgi:microcystin-dependent protein
MGQLQAGYGYNNNDKKFVTAENLNSQVTAARLTGEAITQQTETFTTLNTDSVLLGRTGSIYKSTKSVFTDSISGSTSSYTNSAAEIASIVVENRVTITNKNYTTNGTTVTVNNVTQHNLNDGETVNVTASNTNYSGQYRVVVTSPTTFTYDLFSAVPVANGTLSYYRVGTLYVEGNERIEGNLEVTGAIKSLGVLFKPSNFVPASAIMSFACSTAPSGWLECNGDAVSRTTYADLFAAIGTTFGSGNNTTTFNLPDLRGEFIRGWDHGRTVDNGRAFGSSQEQQLQKHKHISSNNDCQNYTAINGVGTGNTNTWCDTNGISMNSTSASLTGDGGHTEQTAKLGTETRPRNIALMYCIKY